MKKIITIMAFMCLMITGCGENKLNNAVYIKSDGIKLTILGAENTTINNEDYTKVKMEIENYGGETYYWYPETFTLGKITALQEEINAEDALPTFIDFGQTTVGYIYFPFSKIKKLTYTSRINAGDSQNTEISKFKIK